MYLALQEEITTEKNNLVYFSYASNIKKEHYLKCEDSLNVLGLNVKTVLKENKSVENLINLIRNYIKQADFIIFMLDKELFENEFTYKLTSYEIGICLSLNKVFYLCNEFDDVNKYINESPFKMVEMSKFEKIKQDILKKQYYPKNLLNNKILDKYTSLRIKYSRIILMLDVKYKTIKEEYLIKKRKNKDLTIREYLSFIETNCACGLKALYFGGDANFKRIQQYPYHDEMMALMLDFPPKLDFTKIVLAKCNNTPLDDDVCATIRLELITPINEAIGVSFKTYLEVSDMVYSSDLIKDILMADGIKEEDILIEKNRIYFTITDVSSLSYMNVVECKEYEDKGITKFKTCNYIFPK